MNQIAAWVHTPLAIALGWTLVHFMWEGAILAALLASGLTICRDDARRRYALACAVLALMPVVFAVTFLVLWEQGRATGPAFPVILGGVVRPALESVPVAPRLSVAGVLQRLAWFSPLWMF